MGLRARLRSQAYFYQHPPRIQYPPTFLCFNSDHLLVFPPLGAHRQGNSLSRSRYIIAITIEVVKSSHIPPCYPCALPFSKSHSCVQAGKYLRNPSLLRPTSRLDTLLFSETLPTFISQERPLALVQPPPLSFGADTYFLGVLTA